MSTPRQVLKGQFYMLTRRCTQRQFLMRPDDATNNAFLYCLGEAARRFGIEVIVSLAEPNHHHTVIFDREGRCPEVLEHFHKMFARCQNALRGRWENFWASEEPCVTRLLDTETVIDKIVYAVTNPVKDHLVERVHQWPGVNTYAELLSGRTLHARRPLHFFRDNGPMPATITLTMTIPAELGPVDEIRAQVRAAVESTERDVAAERQRTGARVYGRRRILDQAWNASPTSVEARRMLRPRFAGGTQARVAAIQAFREFVRAYR